MPVIIVREWNHYSPLQQIRIAVWRSDRWRGERIPNSEIFNIRVREQSLRIYSRPEGCERMICASVQVRGTVPASGPKGEIINICDRLHLTCTSTRIVLNALSCSSWLPWVIWGLGWYLRVKSLKSMKDHWTYYTHEFGGCDVLDVGWLWCLNMKLLTNSSPWTYTHCDGLWSISSLALLAWNHEYPWQMIIEHIYSRIIRLNPV